MPLKQRLPIFCDAIFLACELTPMNIRMAYTDAYLAHFHIQRYHFEGRNI